ncbi:MAG: AraC family transcriptional regulator [Terrimicrobiaceae bacterium]
MSATSPKASFGPALQDALRRLRTGRLKILIPPPVGLFRRWPKAHFHGTAEFFYQTGGATDFDCPGDAFRVSRGEVCIIPSGVPHAETRVNLSTDYAALVAMHNATGFTLLNAIADDLGRIGNRELTNFNGPCGQRAFGFLEEAATASAVDPSLRRAFITSLVEAFLLALLSDLAQDSPPLVMEHSSPLASKARKHVLAQLTDPQLSVAGIARQLSCHPDHLSRIFQKNVGATLGEWILRERIQSAKSLLAQSHHNVSEVCWACGFSSPSYFIRVFRARTGSTPGQFRTSAQTHAKMG